MGDRCIPQVQNIQICGSHTVVYYEDLRGKQHPCRIPFHESGISDMVRNLGFTARFEDVHGEERYFVIKDAISVEECEGHPNVALQQAEREVFLRRLKGLGEIKSLTREKDTPLEGKFE